MRRHPDLLVLKANIFLDRGLVAEANQSVKMALSMHRGHVPAAALDLKLRAEGQDRRRSALEMGLKGDVEGELGMLQSAQEMCPDDPSLSVQKVIILWFISARHNR